MLRSLLLATATLIASVSAQTDAKTFRVVTQGASKIIAVQSPKDASKRSIFVLAPAGTQRLSNVTVAGALGSSVMAEAVRYFTTPLQRVAVLANTHLPWFDAIGRINTIKAVSSASTIHSTCVRANLASGATVDVTSSSGYGTDRVKLSASNVDAVFCDAAWGCEGTDKDVPLRDYEETTVQAVAEYAQLIAHFFDAEAEAAAAASVATLKSRYACSKRTAADAAPLRATSAAKSKVLWAYEYAGYWYTASSNTTWYNPLVTDAGAELLTTSVVKASAAPHYGGLTLQEIAPLFAVADVIVYANDNFEDKVRPTLANGTGFSPALAAVLASSPAVSGKRVFDLLGRHINSWFEDRPANPDALLQDLISAAGPDTYSLLRTTAPGARVWLRNVFTEVGVTAMGAVSDAASTSCLATGSPSTKTSAVVSRLSFGCPAYQLGADGRPVDPTAAPAQGGPSAALLGGAIGGTLGGAALLAALGFAVQALLAKQAAAAAAAAVTAKLPVDAVAFTVANPVQGA